MVFGVFARASGAPDAAAGRSLDALLTGEQRWDTTADAFTKELGGAGIQWLDAGKSRARFFGAGLMISDYNRVAKRMPMDNACAMTTGMYYLEPIQ
ncbi:MAG: hypothetical protein RLZZ282_877 [Verrucomicrobiota bacterium]